MSTHHDDPGSDPARRRPRLGLTTLLVVAAVVGLAAMAMSAYGGSDRSSGNGTDLSGKARAGYAEFRDCMAAEGVEISPDGPPAESEKTDEMRAAFEKCGDLIPSDVRERFGGGGSVGVLN